MPQEEPLTDAGILSLSQEVQHHQEELAHSRDALYLECQYAIEGGVTITHLARILGVSRQWLYKAVDKTLPRREAIEAARSLREVVATLPPTVRVAPPEQWDTMNRTEYIEWADDITVDRDSDTSTYTAQQVVDGRRHVAEMRLTDDIRREHAGEELDQFIRSTLRARLSDQIARELIGTASPGAGASGNVEMFYDARTGRAL